MSSHLCVVKCFGLWPTFGEGSIPKDVSLSITVIVGDARLLIITIGGQRPIAHSGVAPAVGASTAPAGGRCRSNGCYAASDSGARSPPVPVLYHLL